MQYYKGKAIRPDVPEPRPATTVTERKRSLFNVFMKILLFPFLIGYWSLQDLVYKSMEESD